MFHLKPFPGGLNSSDFSIEVQVQRKQQELDLTFIMRGRYHDLKIPFVSKSAQRKDFLWEHTCFELFIAEADSEAYEEWNFSPSGDWAHYHFDHYRVSSTRQSDLEPYDIVWMEVGAQEARLSVSIPLRQPTPLDLGLSAVLELKAGQKSYWALEHTASKPDFHRRESFLARI